MVTHIQALDPPRFDEGAWTGKQSKPNEIRGGKKLRMAAKCMHEGLVGHSKTWVHRCDVQMFTFRTGPSKQNTYLRNNKLSSSP